MIISTKNCVEESIFYFGIFVVHTLQLIRCQCFGVCFFAAGEDLEAFVATQDLLAFESENIREDLISEYLGDESDQRTRFEKPITVNEIKLAKRKRENPTENSAKCIVVSQRLPSLG